MESWSACEGPHPCGRRSFDLVCSQTVLPAESDCPAPPRRASRSASLPDALASRFMLPCGPVPHEANRNTASVVEDRRRRALSTLDLRRRFGYAFKLVDGSDALQTTY